MTIDIFFYLNPTSIKPPELLFLNKLGVLTQLLILSMEILRLVELKTRWAETKGEFRQDI
jgi:hypothetical protein